MKGFHDRLWLVGIAAPKEENMGAAALLHGLATMWGVSPPHEVLEAAMIPPMMPRFWKFSVVTSLNKFPYSKCIEVAIVFP